MFLSAASSICYFYVSGDDVAVPLQNLADNGFRSIEHSADELSTGWVHFGDYDNSDFAENLGLCLEDQYLCFSLRQDRRRVPAVLLKRRIDQLCDKFLAEHPQLKFVPKAEKENIRDQSRSELMAKSLATPSFWDVVWDTDRRLIRFCSMGQKTIDTFQALFHQTFPGLRLTLVHPMLRAATLIPDSLSDRLQAENQAVTESVLEQIEANRWLGSDFLLWLLYRTLNSDSRYAVSVNGPLLSGQPFTAFLDTRLVMLGAGQEGLQKVVSDGNQDHYAEVMAALGRGKIIREAALHLQMGDDLYWKVTVGAERLQFGGYRTPMIKSESHPDDDPQAEAIASFLTKIGAVEEGEQMFNSLLREFLVIRLGNDWPGILRGINAWLEH